MTVNGKRMGFDESKWIRGESKLINPGRTVQSAFGRTFVGMNQVSKMAG